jgi:REP element-mobilizing transposase RayT
VQQQIRWPNAAGDLRGRTREARPRGKRRIGRPKKPGAGVPHVTRKPFDKTRALHVTLRVLDVIGRLRTRSAYAAIREAAITVLEHDAFRIVQLSIEGTHLHLLVEADSRAALSLGMQAFEISAAKHLNAACLRAGSWWERKRAARLGHSLPKRRKARVFSDRYHETFICTPRQARHALAYVLNNWRRHREDRRALARTWLIDPFATGWAFDGWKERADTPFAWKLRETYKPIPVWLPKTWLLREGWRRYGLIGVREVPGAQAGPREPRRLSGMATCPSAGRPARARTRRLSGMATCPSVDRPARASAHRARSIPCEVPPQSGAREPGSSALPSRARWPPKGGVAASCMATDGSTARAVRAGCRRCDRRIAAPRTATDGSTALWAPRERAARSRCLRDRPDAARRRSDPVSSALEAVARRSRRALRTCRGTSPRRRRRSGRAAGARPRGDRTSRAGRRWRLSRRRRRRGSTSRCGSCRAS